MRFVCQDAISFLRGQERQARCCVTSPPYYGLRDYGLDPTEWPPMSYSMPGGVINVEAMTYTLGQEPSPYDFIGHLVLIFRELRNVLTDDGTLWLNMGDTYAANRSYQVASTKGGTKHAPAQGFEGSKMKVPDGMKAKDMMLVPSMLALALRDDGWWLRQDVIWKKDNAMPESVRDRPTLDYEHVLMLTKSARYFYDEEAVREPAVGQTAHDLTGPGCAPPGRSPSGGDRSSDGQPVEATRRRRSVWSINTQAFKDAHFAVFPPDLVTPCVLASSEPGDLVIDPFTGSGTTAIVAEGLGREFAGSELSPDYWLLAFNRIMAARSFSKVPS